MVQMLDAPVRPPARIRAATHSERTRPKLPAGWPVAMLFLGYPLWWALGLTDVAGFVAALAMVAELARRRTIRVPPAFAVLALFLGWVVLGGILLAQVAAPGAVGAHDVNRYLTSGWRLLWYLKATVLLLYLGNERERLSQTWVCRTFGWMFVWIVAGGLLGVLAPTFSFPSAAELVLPHGLATTPFVYSNIHPIAAESFAEFLGGQHRTSAPFPYANVWGLNFACFLPFFVIGWVGRDAGQRRRRIGIALLAISVVPAILSSNRGLWLALACMTVLVLIRAVLAGQLRLVLRVVFAAVVLTAIVAATPLGGAVLNRLNGNGPSSEQTRSNLTSLTVDSVRDGSPLLGFGATRPVQGNFDSIAGGATTSCRRCAPPALGTQGQLLLVGFTQGLVGVVLYFGFLVATFLRHIRTRSRFALAGLAVLTAHVVTSTVYSADNLAVLAIFAAVAMLWRAGVAQKQRDPAGQRFSPDERMLADVVRAGRRLWRPLTALLLLGVLVGGAFAYRAGATYRATASLFLAADPSYPTDQQLPSTVDAIARAARTDVALRAMRAAAGTGVHVELGRLGASATPNTRILHLTYAGDSPDAARTVSTAAADAVLHARAVALYRQRHSVLIELTDRRDAITTAVQHVLAAEATSRQRGAVSTQLDALRAKLHDASTDLTAAAGVAPIAGHVLGAPRVVVDHDAQLLDVANGLGAGVLLAAGLIALRSMRTPRLAAGIGGAGVSVVASGDFADRDIVLRYRPSAAVVVGADPDVLARADALDACIPAADRLAVPARIVLVASGRERERAVRTRAAALRTVGADIVGVAVIGGPAQPTTHRADDPPPARAGEGEYAVDFRGLPPADAWHVNPLAVLRRGWLVLLVAALVGGAAGWALVGPRVPAYTAHAEVRLDPLAGAPLSDASQSSAQLTAAMNAEATAIHSSAVVAAVAHELRSSTPIAAAAISASIVNNTNYLVISVRARSPGRAQQAAQLAAEVVLSQRAAATRLARVKVDNSIAAQLKAVQAVYDAAPTLRAAVVRYAGRQAALGPQLRTHAADAVQAGSITTLPIRPQPPNRLRAVWYALAGVAVGLLLAAVLLLWRGRRERTMRSGTVSAIAGCPVLAVLPPDCSACRAVRTALLATDPGGAAVAVLPVTAPNGATGEVVRQTVRTFAAVGMSASGVDARRSRPIQGIPQILLGPRFRAALDDLRARRPFVLAAAAAAGTAEGEAVAMAVGDAILVGTDGRTRVGEVRLAAAQLRALGVRVRGVVLVRT